MFTEFTLGYYRAYAEPQAFCFSRPEGSKLGLNVIVGQNNSGKSTALSILKDLFIQSPDFILDTMSRVGDNSPVVNLEFHFDNGLEHIFCEERAEGFYVKRVGNLENTQSQSRRDTLRKHVRFLPSRRSWTDRFDRTAVQPTQQLEEQLFGLRPNQDAQLGYILSNIIREGEKPEFDKTLKRVMPDVIDWGVNRFLDQDYVEYKSPSGSAHALSLLGDGFASVFRMTHVLYSSKPGDVVILDEPERSLHPDAQKSLYLLLSELAKDRQVIIATHSPYMVDWADLGRGAKVFRVGLDGAGTAKVHSLSEEVISSVMPAVEVDIRNRKLFDVLAKEVFFRSRVVFCEGQEDVHYIENYLSVEKRNPLPLFGYGSGGASWIKKWLALAEDLGIRAAALYDANEYKEAQKVEEHFKDNSNAKVWVLPTDDIRDKGEGDTFKQGIFDTSGKINAAYQPTFNTMLEEIENWLIG